MQIVIILAQDISTRSAQPVLLLGSYDIRVLSLILGTLMENLVVLALGLLHVVASLVHQLLWLGHLLLRHDQSLRRLPLHFAGAHLAIVHVDSVGGWLLKHHGALQLLLLLLLLLVVGVTLVAG